MWPSLARESLTVVSSFSHLDVDLARVRPGSGVELLRNYLQYASTNGRRLGDAELTTEPLNAFEAEVFDCLSARGLRLIPQMGASRSRIADPSVVILASVFQRPAHWHYWLIIVGTPPSLQLESYRRLSRSRTLEVLMCDFARSFDHRPSPNPSSRPRGKADLSRWLPVVGEKGAVAIR